jgi:hypothetical protein
MNDDSCRPKPCASAVAMAASGWRQTDGDFRLMMEETHINNHKSTTSAIVNLVYSKDVLEKIPSHKAIMLHELLPQNRQKLK